MIEEETEDGIEPRKEKEARARVVIEWGKEELVAELSLMIGNIRAEAANLRYVDARSFANLPN